MRSIWVDEQYVGIADIKPFSAPKRTYPKWDVFFYIVIGRDSNTEWADSVKQNSPVDCFVGGWCTDGHRECLERSSSSKDALHPCPFQRVGNGDMNESLYLHYYFYEVTVTKPNRAIAFCFVVVFLAVKRREVRGLTG